MEEGVPSEGDTPSVTEVGWYVLGENQELVGPYALPELQGGRDDAKLSVPATVVLHHMFTTVEIRDDETLLPELETDVKEECTKFGPVDSVKVYPNNPDGIVLVKFKDRKDATECIGRMNGRWFAGRQIDAREDDGSINYALIRDDVADVERLEQFGRELEVD